MSVYPPAWQAAYQRLCDNFWQAAGSPLRHLRARPVGAAQRLPREYRQALERAEFRREGTWAPGYPELPTYEQSERSWLSGDKAAADQFDRLASLAWQAFLGTRDGKAQYAPTAANDTDRWLAVVYRQLEYDLTVGPNYFQEQDCLVFHLDKEMERIEKAENYALPVTYGPIRDRDDRPAPDGPFDRWRITALTTDVFAASAVALDVLPSDPYAGRNRVISWQEMDAYQRSSVFQQANGLIDRIRLAHGGTFPIRQQDGQPSSRALPSICPRAEPKPPVELRPDGEMLAMIEARYRSLRLIGDDESLHWVGRQQTRETTCICNLVARPGAPRSEEWQSLRQLRQAVVALFLALHTCAVSRFRMQQFREAGVVRSEQSAPDMRPFDRLEQRIVATATAAGVALPEEVPVIPAWLRSPDGLPQSDAWARWKSEWRAVRVAVETRLAALDGGAPPASPNADAGTLPPPAPPVSPEPPADGTVKASRIWLKGKPYRLTPGLRDLLAYLLANPSVPEERVIEHCGMSCSPHLHKRLKNLRDKLAEELKRSGWRLRIKTEETRISCKWEEAKK
jgi:hypothetical protein